MHILIPLLQEGLLHSELAIWLAKTAFERPKDVRFSFANIQTNSIPQGRNRAAQLMLDNGCDWLVFVDSDVVPHPEMMTHLYPKMRDRDCLIWAAPYPINTAEKGLIWSCGPMPPTENGSVYWAGTGCMAIAREVFERMDSPWFDDQLVANGTTQNPSDDIWFCEAAKRKGFKIRVLPEHPANHLKTGPLPSPGPFRRAGQVGYTAKAAG